MFELVPALWFLVCVCVCVCCWRLGGASCKVTNITLLLVCKIIWVADFSWTIFQNNILVHIWKFGSDLKIGPNVKLWTLYASVRVHVSPILDRGWLFLCVS